MRRANFSLVLAVIVIAIGIVQWVRPFSAAPVNPFLIIIAGLLLVARYAAARQRAKRAEMLAKVPEHPLGLSDEE